MLLKERDLKDNNIKELSDLLDLKSISYNQRFFIEREISNIKKGEKGEDNSAYHINFYYQNSKNYIVIHDLRIEYKGQSIQIDHLLINRLFEIYVVESKNYSYNVIINDHGEFAIKYKNGYIGIDSPIEQTNRHIHLLKKFIKENKLTPKRLGIPITPSFHNYVLFNNKASIQRSKKFDSSIVIKADMLATKIDESIDKMKVTESFSKVAKISSMETIEKFAKDLLSYHKPSNPNYRAKFGIADHDFKIEFEGQSQNEIKVEEKNNSYYCFNCKKPVTNRVATFCWSNPSKFNKKVYCYDCQKIV
jgi:hypothetical protein